MAQTDWHLLTQLLDSNVTPTSLPANLESIIAERIEEALAAPDRQDLNTVKNELANFFRVLMQRASPDARAAVRGGPSAPESGVAAFWLGHVAFAQLIAAQAAERRADDKFADIFQDENTAKYIRVLATGDHTGQELAAALKVRPETVSRRLNELRELGAVDYRRNGTSLYNFLTPQARTAFECLHQPDSAPHRDANKGRLLKARHRNVSPEFQERPTLSGPAWLGH